mgnify:CR=1 FL=1
MPNAKKHTTKQQAKRVKAGTSKAAAADRRRRFVEAYIENGCNATQAAKAAGYSPKTAYRTGADILKEPQIAAEINRRRAEVLVTAQENTGLTVDGTLRELRSIVHSDLRQAFDSRGKLLHPLKWPDELARAMCSVKVTGRNNRKVTEVKVWDKNSGLEKAMKKFGMLIERKEIGEPGAFDQLDDDELTRAAAEAESVIAAARGAASDDRKARNRGRDKAQAGKA